MNVSVHFSPLYKLRTRCHFFILELFTKCVHYFFKWFTTDYLILIDLNFNLWQVITDSFLH